MKKKSSNHKGMGRRQVLPILGTGLLLPLLPASAQTSRAEEDQEYVTLLKADGSAVRIKASKLKKSKVVRKNISNGELRQWLDKGEKNS
jgi:hypothetical protein